MSSATTVALVIMYMAKLEDWVGQGFASASATSLPHVPLKFPSPIVCAKERWKDRARQHKKTGQSEPQKRKRQQNPSEETECRTLKGPFWGQYKGRLLSEHIHRKALYRTIAQKCPSQGQCRKRPSQEN
jgi:hypothetical protein